MTNAAKLGLLLMALGLVLALGAALADPLGIGGHPDFGWKQIVGVVVGILLIAGGWVLQRRGSGNQRPKPGS